jgi:hypothetical protein
LILEKTGMGGFGSGMWYRFRRKRTVEESLTLAAGDFKDHLNTRASGTFTWIWPAGHQAQVGFQVSWDVCGPIVTLNYQWSDGEIIRTAVRLQSTATNFQGRRWWFTCPLAFGDIKCKRRAGKLHLPPGSRFFGCRLCHNLTYRSSREAHRADPLLRFWQRQQG